MEDEEVDIVDSLVLSSCFERVERWGEDVCYTYPSFQCVLYIVQVNEDFIDYLKVIIHFFVDVVLCVECHRVGQEVFYRRSCRSLYCFRVSPSSENTCSGSHEASEIG